MQFLYFLVLIFLFFTPVSLCIFQERHFSPFLMFTWVNVEAQGLPITWFHSFVSAVESTWAALVKFSFLMMPPLSAERRSERKGLSPSFQTLAQICYCFAWEPNSRLILCLSVRKVYLSSSTQKSVPAQCSSWFLLNVSFFILNN